MFTSSVLSVCLVFGAEQIVNRVLERHQQNSLVAAGEPNNEL